jgi:hypothetical protein
MRVTSKVILSCLVVLGAVLIIRHGEEALQPALPKDMPNNAVFVAAGYDIAHNEKQGEWIACSNDPEQGTDRCRVTDPHGTVIYEGEFLPVNGSQPLPADQLKVATSGKADIWVQGPAEQGPVPVIPLANGAMLVPSADAYALGARWSKNPDELRRLASE